MSFKTSPLKLETRMRCTDTQRLVSVPAAHLSTINIVEDKVQFVSGLEREVKAHQERVFYILQ